MRFDTAATGSGRCAPRNDSGDRQPPAIILQITLSVSANGGQSSSKIYFFKSLCCNNQKGGETVKKFWGCASNDKFFVGCTGQTVYLCDKNGNEIKKFKDIIYGYVPMISPDGTLFVVKSTDGRLAVYSLETFSFIRKFRFSKVDGAQDDGFCFSPDGKWFINIERQKDALHSAISVYDTTDFSLTDQVLAGEEMMLNHIEFDEATSTYYVLGFMRDANRVIDHGFVAKFEENKIKNMTAVPENEYNFYRSYKHLEIMGFSEKACQWSYMDHELDTLKAAKHTLADLYMRCKK